MGVVETMLRWHEIVGMVETGNFNFGRTQRAADSYKNHRAKIREEWRDLNSYCKHRMLRYPYTTDILNRAVAEETSRKVAKKYVEDDADCTGPRLVVTDNEFPYAFSPDVTHMLIWSADEISRDEYRRFAERYFSTDEYDLVVFVNPVHLKSVRGVHHAHVLLRKKETCQRNLEADCT